MNVSSILRRKGTQVETATSRTRAHEAAQRMTAKGIGSLVLVDDEGHLLGVLSERDLVRALSAHGPSAWEVPVADLMRARPVTCGPEDSLRRVMALMTRSRTRHVPVLAGEARVGIVSIGDVVKGQLEELELEVGVLRDYARMRV